MRAELCARIEMMGCGQAAKARGFDPRIPRFESWHPSQIVRVKADHPAVLINEAEKSI